MCFIVMLDSYVFQVIVLDNVDVGVVVEIDEGNVFIFNDVQSVVFFIIDSVGCVNIIL